MLTVHVQRGLLIIIVVRVYHLQQYLKTYVSKGSTEISKFSPPDLLFIYKIRPLSEPLKPFILGEEPLPLKCILYLLRGFIFI